MDDRVESTPSESPQAMSFAEATRVADGAHPEESVVSVSPTRVKHATVHDGWDILGNTNGGYLLAICGRALASELDRAYPLTITAHYLSPGRAGPVRIETDTVRAGRRYSTGRATMFSGDRAVMTVLGTFHDEIDTAAPLLANGAPPSLPPFDECPLSDRNTAPDFMSKVDLRLHPDDAGFAKGQPTGRAHIRAWFQLVDGELFDPYGLLLAADALPPTIFNANLPVGWAPTVELTVHVRAMPAAGPLRCDVSTRFVAGGLLEVDGEVWDSEDRLVVQSRQLALVPKGG